MVERSVSDHFHSSQDECDRAHVHFKAVVGVHNAAIQAFEIFPTIPASEESAAMWLRLRALGKGVQPSGADLAGAQQMLETMTMEGKGRYQVIRGSALIAVCAAFEYLLKATFVSQAAHEPAAAAALLTGAKIKLLAADVLGAPEMEQWFAIADQLFLQMPNAPASMSERVRMFLTKYTYVSEPGGFSSVDSVLQGASAAKFDEAFLTRNCLVHNGGRVSSHLFTLTRQPVGELIKFADGDVRSLLRPMLDLSEAMRPWQF